MTVYLVTGRAAYREHAPGTTFEADLDPAAELRALNRGDIHVIERRTTRIQPGTYALPVDWSINTQQEG